MQTDGADMSTSPMLSESDGKEHLVVVDVEYIHVATKKLLLAGGTNEYAVHEPN